MSEPIIRTYCITINPWTKARILVTSRSYKDYGVLTLNEQRSELKSYIRFALGKCLISHMDLTYEITKAGNYHVHGIIECSLDQISDFRKLIYRQFGHISQKERYMDNCIMVKEQFTNDGKWKQYMTKVSNKIYRIVGKDYKYVDNHLKNIEDIYMVECLDD